MRLPLDSSDYRTIRSRFFSHFGLGALFALCLVPMVLLYPLDEMPSTTHKLLFGAAYLGFAGATLYSIYKCVQVVFLALGGQKEVIEGTVEAYARIVTDTKTAGESILVNGVEYRYGRGTAVQLEYPPVSEGVSESELPPWILQKGDRVRIHTLKEGIILRIQKC